MTGILGLIFVWYAVMNLGSCCYVTDYPRGCEASGERCWAAEISWIIAGGPILCLLCFIIYSNVRIYYHVKSILLRNRKYLFQAATGCSPSLSPEIAVQNKFLKQMRIQSILYVAAFWGTSLPTLAKMILEGSQYPVHMESHIFALHVVQSILTPSFGIWTCLIFFRPRYHRVVQDFGSQTFWWRIRRTLHGESVEPVGISHTMKSGGKQGTSVTCAESTATSVFSATALKSTLGEKNQDKEKTSKPLSATEGCTETCEN